MTADVVSFYQMFFSRIWEMFGVNFPGTNFTIAEVLLGFLAISITISALKILLGLGDMRENLTKMRSSSKDKKSVKISKEREHDTK